MRILLAATALILAAPSAPLLARPGGWNDGYAGYGNGFGDSLMDQRARSSGRRDPREGRVQVTRFVASDAPADLLGHGAITVAAPATPERQGGAFADGPTPDLAPAARAPFEAAVIDRLIAAGYDTIHTDPIGGQLAEVRVSRDVLVPAEVKRSPVSGTAAMEVGTRGSAYGLGVNVDMTKPRTALLSTRLDARIKDRATGKVLWEGHSQIATRDGDDKWNDGAIAARLAEALFDDFRHPTG